jgi:hypothetical protein
MARNFPTGLQTQFLQQPGPLAQGQTYAHDPMRDEYLQGLILRPADVSQSNTVTVTYGSAGNFGVMIDGLAIVAAAATNSDTSAANLDAAIQAYIDAYGTDLIASVDSATNVVTIVFGDALPHTVTPLNTGTTTSIVAQVQAAVSYARLNFGLGVCLDPAATFDVQGPNLRAVVGAQSGSSVLAGVLAYSHGNAMPAYQLEALGYDPRYLAPLNPYLLVRKGSVIVPWVGTLPTAPNSAVYWINDPATASHKNKFRSNANGGEADLVSAFVEGVIPESNLVKVKFDL